MRRALLALPGLALLASFLVAGAGLPATAVVLGSNGRIAFASERDGDFEIYSIEPDGTGLLQLTTNAVDDDDPSWSPDGTRIAFVRTGSCQTACKAIWVMDADGTGQTAVTGWFNAIADTAPVVGVVVDPVVHEQPGERRRPAVEGDLVGRGHGRHGDPADRDGRDELRARCLPRRRLGRLRTRPR